MNKANRNIAWRRKLEDKRPKIISNIGNIKLLWNTIRRRKMKKRNSEALIDSSELMSFMNNTQTIPHTLGNEKLADIELLMISEIYRRCVAD